ncbi:hypothetical protein Ancab_032801 [Ancistrocladus abbreviatus]
MRTYLDKLFDLSLSKPPKSLVPPPICSSKLCQIKRHEHWLGFKQLLLNKMRSQCDSTGRLFDITMSRRTRKPLKPVEAEENFMRMDSPSERLEEGSGHDRILVHGDQVNDQMNGHASLKQLINVEGDAKERQEEQDRGRLSLRQHFTEEKQQLQLVLKKHEDGGDGVKLKRIMKRYIRALSRLIKVKGDPHVGSREKPVLRLTK